MAYNKLTLAEKLAIKSKPDGDCIVWTGAKTKLQYGMIRINGKWKRAHRVMYEMVHGKIKDNLVVMHSCDNPSCININHLSVGTQNDNMQDMHQKGRANPCSGENHPCAKLSVDDVRKIRSRYEKGSRKNGASQLAREFNVSKQTVLTLLKNATWK